MFRGVFYFNNGVIVVYDSSLSIGFLYSAVVALLCVIAECSLPL